MPAVPSPAWPRLSVPSLVDLVRGQKNHALPSLALHRPTRPRQDKPGLATVSDDSRRLRDPSPLRQHTIKQLAKMRKPLHQLFIRKIEHLRFEQVNELVRVERLVHS